MRARLKPQEIRWARCTVERLKGTNGWRSVRGLRETKMVRTTVLDPGADMIPDLVGRQVYAAAPDLLCVADFTKWVRRVGQKGL